MKILHIMAARGNGGAETYSTDVMLSLHAAGVAQCIVISRAAPRFEELRAAGLHLAPEVLDAPIAALQRRRLRALIEAENPTIVQAWMRRAASLVPAGCKAVRPVIGWFGGYYDPDRFGACSHFVGVTEDIRAHMIAQGVPAEHAFFLPTFPDITDQPAVDRASLDTPATARVLLTLSRLHPKKGLDTLIQTLPSLPDCVAWLAGDGELLAELRALAAKLGVADRVKFLGWRTDRAALLRAADVCVLPSRYEPFGTVILEAWAAGTPLVACRAAGPAAHVRDGIDGLLAPIDDPPALAARIRRALDDFSLRKNLVEAGALSFQNGFTREAVTTRWRDFYQGLLETGQPR